MKKSILNTAMIVVILGAVSNTFAAPAGTVAPPSEVEGGFRLGTCGGVASNNANTGRCRSSVVTDDGSILLKNNNGIDLDGYTHTGMTFQGAFGQDGSDGDQGDKGDKGDKGDRGESVQYDDSDLRQEIDTVNKEDMRVKSGNVDGDTMTLRVEDMAKSRGRDFIYGKDVDIDVSGLNQADEVIENANDISSLDDRLVVETDERISADNALSAEDDRIERDSIERDKRINTETIRVDNQSIERDTILSETIESETNNRVIMDNNLQSQIDRSTRATRSNQQYAADNHRRIVDTNMRIDLLADEMSDTNVRIDNLAQDMDHLKDDVYSGLAGIAAMGSIPNATVGKTAIGVGYGNYGGKDAAAVGLSTRSENGKHAISLSTTFTTKETGVAAGYSFSF